MQQEQDPDTVIQLLTQIGELQEKVDFLSDAREFHDPPNQHRIISSSIRRPSCDSGVPRNTRHDMSIRVTVF